MKKYDVIVVGAGPSGVFLAYEMLQLDKTKKVLLIEQGKAVEKRCCPIEKVGKCVNCSMCNITCGFSGAGAFSDGKLSLYNKDDDNLYVGGYLHEYVGVKRTKELIDYVDSIYLHFGADPKLEGVEYKSEVEEISKKAKKENLNLINIPIRHLGTEKSHEIYTRIENYLLDRGVEILFDTCVSDLYITDNQAREYILDLSLN